MRRVWRESEEEEGEEEEGEGGRVRRVRMEGEGGRVRRVRKRKVREEGGGG